MSLYPAGYFVRDIPVVASLTLPVGWKGATALRPTAISPNNKIIFEEVSHDTLINLPVFAGKYFRSDDLGHGVNLNTVADTPKELVIPPDVLAKHRALADQAVKLFGARHFDHYDFLHAVTDRLGGIGLEHHRSSENKNDPGYFIDWEASIAGHNLLPHEFIHSWNGKFRRGADLWTPDYRTPMQDSLLWVYEGQTQFWGHVLEAHSGLSTKQQVLDKLALIAANLDNLPGCQIASKGDRWSTRPSTRSCRAVAPSRGRAISAPRIITMKGYWFGPRPIRSCARKAGASDRWTISRTRFSASTTATLAR